MQLALSARTRILASILCLVMAFTGCSTSWVAQAEAIVNLALPAVVNILALVAAFSGRGVSPADVDAVNKIGQQVNLDLTLVGALIDEYKKASAADRPSVLGKLDAALKTAQGHLTDVLAALHVSNPALQAKVQAVVGLVLGELAQIYAIVDAARSKTVTARARAGTLSAKGFKNGFNAAMGAPSGDAQVDDVTSKLALK